MTVSTTTARNVKTGNGVTTSFPFDFAFEADGDLVVTLVVTATGVETLQTLTTDYTTTGGSGATGTIEMIVAPATGEELVIERNLAYTQGVDYQPNDPFPAEVNETALDRLTFLVQQVLDFTQRSIKLKKTTTLTDVVIPDPEIDKILVGKTTTEFENKLVSDLASTVITLPVPIAQGGTNATTAVAARTNLAAAGNPLTAALDTGGNAIDESEGTNVASGSSTNIWVTNGNTVHVTGTGTIDDFATAPRVGALRRCIADGAFTLADSATIIVPGNANFTVAVDDSFWVFAETTTTFRVFGLQRADGTPVAGGAGRLLSVQVFTTSGTWTPTTSDVGPIVVEVIAGGGGGGGGDGVAAENSAAGGGGAGGYSTERIGAPGATETVTVGTGGAGGAAGNNAGVAGLTSSFGSGPADLTATGGAGGAGGSSTATDTTGGTGGAGGAGADGDVNGTGGDGGGGIHFGGGTGFSGAGGDSILGGGGAQVANAGVGEAATANTGGGGSGAATNDATDRVGGNGAAGLVVVWEYSK